MPPVHPKEFRDNVSAVARRGEMPSAQVAKDFGINESCLQGWLAKADVGAGTRLVTSAAENTELKEVRRRVRLLEQWRPLPRAGRTRSCAVRRRTCRRRT